MESSDRNKLLDLVRFAVFLVTVAAVVKEVRLPRDQRTWHGAIGPVPYDFRRPTLDRLRERLWSPGSGLIQPQPFGVGWTLNLGGLLRKG